jgi:hypothetical protein
MDIEKELENLKKEYQELLELRNEKIADRKEEIISSVIESFEQYFTSKDYKIKEISGEISANNNGLKITLKYPDAGESFFGAFLVFNLYVESETNREFTIMVNESGGNPVIGADIGVSYYSKDNPLEKEYYKINSDMKKVKRYIENLSRMEINFGLIDDNEVKSNPILKEQYPVFESFEELLDEILK